MYIQLIMDPAKLSDSELIQLSIIRSELEQMFDSEYRIDKAMEDYTRDLIANRTS